MRKSSYKKPKLQLRKMGLKPPRKKKDLFKPPLRSKRLTKDQRNAKVRQRWVKEYEQRFKPKVVKNKYKVGK